MTNNQNQAYINTNRELWRRPSTDPLDPGGAYEPSVFVTPDNLIGINSGGTVVILSPEEWISLYPIPKVIQS